MTDLKKIAEELTRKGANNIADGKGWPENTPMFLEALERVQRQALGARIEWPSENDFLDIAMDKGSRNYSTDQVKEIYRLLRENVNPKKTPYREPSDWDHLWETPEETLERDALVERRLNDGSKAH